MSLPRWSKFFGALPVVLALAGLAGCEKPSADDESTDVAPSELAAEPSPAKQHKAGPARGDHRHPPRGPAMLLGAALHNLELTDAQESTIRAELDALRETAMARPDHDASRAALAAAVKSGRVDEAALVASAAPPAPDTTRLAKAMSVLHETLTPAQRKDLIASVKTHMERGGPAGDHKPHMRHDAEDDADDAAHGPGKHARGDRGPGKHARGKHGFGAGGPVAHMLRGLSLSDAQRDQVKGALEKLAPNETDRAAMKAQHEAFRTKMTERLAAFANDSFDANAFVALPEGDAKHGPDRMFGHMVKALAAVVPILDDAQRAELAKRIEEGPTAPPGAGKPWKGKARGQAD